MERNDTVGQHSGIELLDVLDREVRRFTTMAAAADPARPVPHSTWTVGDTVAHLATGMDAYARYLTGDTTPVIDISDVAGGSIGASNARRLAADDERDIPTLLRLLDERFAELRHAAMRMDLDDEVSWHGRPIPLRTMLATAIGEFHMHGRDLAVAFEQPWPLPRRDAALTIDGLAPLLPILVDPASTRDLHALVRLRVREGPELGLAFDRGTLNVGPCGDRRPDVTISADPEAFLLVAYGRASQWPAIATGKLVAWGRRPWLAMRLTSYLVSP
jgi:uncharacterized protein (TIGR03083 family)